MRTAPSAKEAKNKGKGGPPVKGAGKGAKAVVGVDLAKKKVNKDLLLKTPKQVPLPEDEESDAGEGA